MNLFTNNHNRFGFFCSLNFCSVFHSVFLPDFSISGTIGFLQCGQNDLPTNLKDAITSRLTFTEYLFRRIQQIFSYCRYQHKAFIFEYDLCLYETIFNHVHVWTLYYLKQLCEIFEQELFLFQTLFLTIQNFCPDISVLVLFLSIECFVNS